MNANLIGSGIGALLTLAAIVPTNLMDSPSPQATASNQVDTTLQQGNLTISTIPGNAWVRVEDYSYVPRVPPRIDLAAWPQNVPLRAVVRDRNNTCIGRITDETGVLSFVFVEADLAMCTEPLPGPRQNTQVVEVRG